MTQTKPPRESKTCMNLPIKYPVIDSLCSVYTVGHSRALRVRSFLFFFFIFHFFLVPALQIQLGQHSGVRFLSQNLCAETNDLLSSHLQMRSWTHGVLDLAGIGCGGPDGHHLLLQKVVHVKEALDGRIDVGSTVRAGLVNVLIIGSRGDIGGPTPAGALLAAAGMGRGLLGDVFVDGIEETVQRILGDPSVALPSFTLAVGQRQHQHEQALLDGAGRVDAVHNLGVRPVLLDLVEDVVAVLIRLGQLEILGGHGQLEAEHIP
jgi:hypothetical protein